MIPTGYSITKKVEPVEKEYIIGYDDLQGNSYVGLRPDFAIEDWANDLIQTVGLAELCRQYPYVHMRVNKNNGTLVPVDGKSWYARITNFFHVLYHMRMDEYMKTHQQYPQWPQQQPQWPQNSANGFTSNFIDMASRSIQEYAFSMDFDKSDDQIPSIPLELEKAYHRKNDEEVIYHQTSPQEAFLETQEDIDNKYSITNVDATISTDFSDVNKQGWHPNPNRNQDQYVGQGIDPSMAYPNPYYQQMMGMNQPYYNPYVYNPQYGNGMMMNSYLPQYKTTSGINTSWPQIDTQFDMFEDATARMREHFEHSTAEAARINQQERMQNPTMLDTSNTLDFSNPESVANLMARNGQYANPMINNMNNPNLMHPPTTPQPYGLNNPYQTISNPGYGYNSFYPSYGFGYGGWYNGYMQQDLSFMEPTMEEIQAGTAPLVRVVRGDNVKPNESIREDESNKSDSTTVKVSVRREYVKEEEQQEQITQKEDNQEKKWFSKEYEEKVNRVADEIAVYDEARALCLVGSLEELSRKDFKIYFDLTLEKIKWYRAQEQIHPDIDYRVPFRYRRLPKKFLDKETGKAVYESYKAPFKKTFLFGDRIVPFYEFDRGEDPSDEEWKDFYEAAEYERDIEIAASKAKAAEKYFEEQDQQDYYNPYDPMSVRMYEYRQAQKKQKQQYDLYRTILGDRVTDEEFDQWWYGSTNTMRSGNPTQQDIADTKRRWKDQMQANHMYKLNNAVPIDQKALSNQFMQRTNAAIREFDRGTMDNCSSVQEFFDNLGYLMVRISEENIEQQRMQSMDQTVSRSAYERSLHRFANEARPGYPIERFLGNYGQLNPSYNMPPNYIDFRSTAHYEQAKQRFMNYCSTSTGTVPLKPIYD